MNENIKTEAYVSVDLRDSEVIALSDRVEELERLVLELLESKRKRSDYMKEYMRRKRDEAKRQE